MVCGVRTIPTKTGSCGWCGRRIPDPVESRSVARALEVWTVFHLATSKGDSDHG